MLEVLVGDRAQLVPEVAGEHALNLPCQSLFLEPGVVYQLPDACDVFVVELESDVARQAVLLGSVEDRPTNLALGIAISRLSKANPIESCLTTE